MINPVNSNDVIMTLIDQNNGSESYTFTCGTTATLNTTAQNYIHCQRNMASAGGITGSAVLQTASFRIWRST